MRVDRSWCVEATGSIELGLSARQAWGQMRDLERFITRDPLHAAVVPGAGRGQAWLGRSVTIRHRFMGLGPDRVGRVLRWREGRGYAVSDLSKRGVRAAFPHVCFYDVVPLEGGGCRLVVAARGKWTARWMGRPLARAWLWWVLKGTELLIRREMAGYGAWLTGRGRVEV